VSNLKTITEVFGNVVDVINREIYPGKLTLKDGKIANIERVDETFSTYLIPGFIDAHVHIESSMLVPTEFARIAVTHGTVGTISDPHEIANVIGMDGINLMIDNGLKSPFYFYFGAPSCVPATAFETAGAEITAADIDHLLSRDDVVYLSEMMNFPGVIYKDPTVMEKLEVARKHDKPIDGHSPGLMGPDMPKYFDSGITTDHECYMIEEARDKLNHGVKIMIREGSAAKNFDELIPLIEDFPEQIMFCCDDKHPDSLMESHIDDHVRRAVGLGYDLFDVLRAASHNVVKHYNLPTGLLQEGDAADFLEVKDLEDFDILKTIIGGQIVAENGQSYLEKVETAELNQFNTHPKTKEDFSLNISTDKVRVIEALDRQLITNEIHVTPGADDLLKIAVVNRYADTDVSTALIRNFGLKSGAIAGSVAHDCHNIVVVGATDEDITRAVNLIIENKGGISLVNGEEEHILPLPIAGIMTNQSAEEAAEAYIRMDRRAKELGSQLSAPFMTLSFMALLVIPELKLSDLGLFNGKEFKFVDVGVA